MRGDRILFVLFALCGAFALVQSSSLEPNLGLGAALVPRLFGLLCVSFGVVGAFLFRGPSAVSTGSLPVRQLLVIALACVAYVVLFPYAGFLWDGILLAIVLTVGFIREGKLWRIILIEVGFMVCMYVIFSSVFQVEFPKGFHSRWISL